MSKKKKKKNFLTRNIPSSANNLSIFYSALMAVCTSKGSGGPISWSCVLMRIVLINTTVHQLTNTLVQICSGWGHVKFECLPITEWGSRHRGRTTIVNYVIFEKPIWLSIVQEKSILTEQQTWASKTTQRICRPPECWAISKKHGLITVYENIVIITPTKHIKTHYRSSNKLTTLWYCGLHRRDNHLWQVVSNCSSSHLGCQHPSHHQQRVQPAVQWPQFSIRGGCVVHWWMHISSNRLPQ